MAWLDATPKGWTKSRRNSAKISATAKEMPPLDDGDEYWIRCVIRAGLCERTESGGARQLSWSEIGAWSKAVQEGLDGPEIEDIAMLSAQYAEEYNLATLDPRRIPAYMISIEDVDREAIAKEQKEGLRRLAARINKRNASRRKDG